MTLKETKMQIADKKPILIIQIQTARSQNGWKWNGNFLCPLLYITCCGIAMCLNVNVKIKLSPNYVLSVLHER